MKKKNGDLIFDVIGWGKFRIGKSETLTTVRCGHYNGLSFNEIGEAGGVIPNVEIPKIIKFFSDYLKSPIGKPERGCNWKFEKK